ncbi:DNA helicase [Giardia muris]|uniref:DNA helicase n=1 Tax=Giardia muris TaxID=5742 RepID=A0A4Z1SSX7_GIAMU|nr:DNA helicase [Giardia muris]|eukprot:TNJ28984.1 DNA helicase [Giardia muris]
MQEVLYTRQKTKKTKSYQSGFLDIKGRTVLLFNEARKNIDSLTLSLKTEVVDPFEMPQHLLQLEPIHIEMLETAKQATLNKSTVITVSTEPSARPKKSKKITKNDTEVNPVSDSAPAQAPVIDSKQKESELQPVQVVTVRSPTYAQDIETLAETLIKLVTRSQMVTFGKTGFSYSSVCAALTEHYFTGRSLAKHTRHVKTGAGRIYLKSLVSLWAETLLPVLQLLATNNSGKPSCQSYSNGMVEMALNCTIMRRMNSAKAQRLRQYQARNMLRAKKIDGNIAKQVEKDSAEGVEGSDIWKLTLAGSEKLFYAKSDLFILTPDGLTCHFFIIDHYQPTAPECAHEFFLQPISDVSKWLSKASYSYENVVTNVDEFGGITAQVSLFHLTEFQLMYIAIETLTASFTAICSEADLPFYSRWRRDMLLDFLDATESTTTSSVATRYKKEKYIYDKYFADELQKRSITRSYFPRPAFLAYAFSLHEYQQKGYFMELNTAQQSVFRDIIDRLQWSFVHRNSSRYDGGRYISDDFYILRGIFGSGKSKLLAAVLLYLLECLLTAHGFLIRATGGVPDSPSSASESYAQKRLKGQEDATAENGLDAFTARILIVSNTNVAVDNLILRLVALADQQGWAHGDPTIHSFLCQFLNRVGSGITNPSLRVYNSLLQELGSHLFLFTTIASVNKVAQLLEETDYFPCIIVDEASQVTEPHLLYVLDEVRYRVELVCLAGDNMQLPPIASSAGMARTTLSRIMRHVEESETICPASTLWMQYRCEKHIADLASTMFYEGRVLTASAHRSCLPIPPVTSLHFGSTFDIATSGSRENQVEAKAVVQIVTALILEHDIQPTDIGVLTPFRAQASLIISLLKKELRSNKALHDKIGASCLAPKPDDEQTSMDAEPVSKTPFKVTSTTPAFSRIEQQITVATVDSFQGSEKMILIVSLTQAMDSNQVSEGKSSHINMINRVNVAITRAMLHLVLLQSYKFSIMWGRDTSSQSFSPFGALTLRNSVLMASTQYWQKIMAYTIDTHTEHLTLESFLGALRAPAPQPLPALFSELWNQFKEVRKPTHAQLSKPLSEDSTLVHQHELDLSTPPNPEPPLTRNPFIKSVALEKENPLLDPPPLDLPSGARERGLARHTKITQPSEPLPLQFATPDDPILIARVVSVLKEGRQPREARLTLPASFTVELLRQLGVQEW